MILFRSWSEMINKKKVCVRLWPAILICLLVAVLLGVTWLGADDSSVRIRQSKVASSAGILAAGTFLLLLWAGLFSGLPRRIRLYVVGGFLLLVLAFFASFRYRGVSGDLVPQFELRFRTSLTNLPESERALPGARDYPQFLGPDRNGTVSGVRLARDWSANPPRLIWRRPVGGGWSGFAVAGNSAVTHEQHSEEERVVSYDLPTGRVNWASREVAHYTNPLAGDGPRSTPTIDQGVVYAMGGTGLLTALDLETGKLLWKRDVLKDNDAKLPVWGKSGSPLVVDGRVVVSAGGTKGKSLVAYDTDSGEILWHGGSDRSAYSSPVRVTLAGVRQIVSFNHDSVTGHHPGNGRLLWRQKWPAKQPNISQPLPLPGDRLLVSAGYGVGSKLLRISRDASGRMSSNLIWESVRLKAMFTNLVYYEGFVYGLDDGILVCLDPETGRRRWKRGRYGHGQVLLVEDLLLVQGEHGDIILVEPDPAELRELARFSVMDAKVWNPPALAGSYLLVRNDEEAALFELPLHKDGEAVRR